MELSDFILWYGGDYVNGLKGSLILHDTFLSHALGIVGITERASEYEVFADDDFLKQGKIKIVAVEILDMEHFDPQNADEIPQEYRQAVAEAYYQYRPSKHNLK